MNKMQYNSDSGLLVKNQQRRGVQAELGAIDIIAIKKYGINLNKNKPTLSTIDEFGIGRPYFEAKMIHSVSGINFKIGFFEDIGGDIGSVIGGKISGSFQSEISWQW